MAKRYDRTASAAAQEAAYRIVRDNTHPAAPSVTEERVLRQLATEGYDREQGRRALQKLLATETIRLSGSRIRPVE